MFESTYDPKRKYDKGLPGVIKKVTDVISKYDDDFLLLIVGATGTGKSNLMMHAYELFDLEGCTSENIAFDFQQFSKSVKNNIDKKGLRFVAYDEANINSRNAMTTENKDIIDLYMTIRGMNMFSIWCNPSANMIDKPFIEERIRGLIYVHGKGKNIRDYYYFTKAQMLKILQKSGNLKLETLKNNKNKSYYHGWFTEYQGKLKKDYLEDKEARMHLKINNFYDKYGENSQSFTAVQMAKRLDCGRTTVNTRHKKLLAEGKLVEDKDFKISPSTGRITWFESAIDIILEDMTNHNGDSVK